jgi:speckle-type POZ protein
MFDSCSFTHQFKLNYEETKNVAIGHMVSSQDISSGGHIWRINCFPRGKKEGKGDYLSVFLELVSESKDDVKAILEAFVLDRDGAPSSSHSERCEHVYPPKVNGQINGWGWPRFVKRSVLEKLYVTDGSVIIMCWVKVVHDEPPPSDIVSHLGTLLDSTDGSGVSFSVGGETFPAHRAVLAARSPVFKKQLLGSMADAKTMSSITIHDIAPATFKVMLRYMYTDACPADAELGDDSPGEMFQNLLAAADRFALDRLKLLCARKLWESLSVDTIAATLGCAEIYNCPKLKTKCIDFFADEKNFKKVVLTDGFVELMHKFPSILAEVREKVGA